MGKGKNHTKEPGSGSVKMKKGSASSKGEFTLKRVKGESGMA